MTACAGGSHLEFIRFLFSLEQHPAQSILPKDWVEKLMSTLKKFQRETETADDQKNSENHIEESAEASVEHSTSPAPADKTREVLEVKDSAYHQAEETLDQMDIIESETEEPNVSEDCNGAAVENSPDEQNRLGNSVPTDLSKSTASKVTIVLESDKECDKTDRLVMIEVWSQLESAGVKVREPHREEGKSRAPKLTWLSSPTSKCGRAEQPPTEQSESNETKPPQTSTPFLTSSERVVIEVWSKSDGTRVADSETEPAGQVTEEDKTENQAAQCQKRREHDERGESPAPKLPRTYPPTSAGEQAPTRESNETVPGSPRTSTPHPVASEFGHSVTNEKTGPILCTPQQCPAVARTAGSIQDRPTQQNFVRNKLRQRFSNPFITTAGRAVGSVHDKPTQLNFVRNKLRKRFSNPFITPVERRAFKVQYRLSFMKRIQMNSSWDEQQLKSDINNNNVGDKELLDRSSPDLFDDCEACTESSYRLQLSGSGVDEESQKSSYRLQVSGSGVDGESQKSRDGVSQSSTVVNEDYSSGMEMSGNEYSYSSIGPKKSSDGSSESRSGSEKSSYSSTGPKRSSDSSTSPKRSSNGSSESGSGSEKSSDYSTSPKKSSDSSTGPKMSRNGYSESSNGSSGSSTGPKKSSNGSSESGSGLEMSNNGSGDSRTCPKKSSKCSSGVQQGRPGKGVQLVQLQKSLNGNMFDCTASDSDVEVMEEIIDTNVLYWPDEMPAHAGHDQSLFSSPQKAQQLIGVDDSFARGQPREEQQRRRSARLVNYKGTSPYSNSNKSKVHWSTFQHFFPKNFSEFSGISKFILIFTSFT